MLEEMQMADLLFPALSIQAVNNDYLASIVIVLEQTFLYAKLVLE